jgi:hypothetical protein
MAGPTCTVDGYLVDDSPGPVAGWSSAACGGELRSSVSAASDNDPAIDFVIEGQLTSDAVFLIEYLYAGIAASIPLATTGGPTCGYRYTRMLR